MYFLKNRIFLCASCAFFLTLYGTIRLSAEWRFILLGIALACVLTAFLVAIRRHSGIKLAFVSVFCAIACLCSALYSLPDRKIAPYLDAKASVTLTVLDVTYQGEYLSTAACRLNSINGEPCRARVEMQAHGSHQFSVGDVLRAEATFSRFEEDVADYAASRGYRAHLTLDYAEKTDTAASLSALCSRWRSRLTAIITERVSGESGALLSAVLLGERDMLSESFRRDMQRIGTAHMLALSGLHVGILLLGIEKLLAFFGLDKRIRYAVLALLVLGYLALTGFAVSTVRSGVMLLIGILGFFLSSSIDDSATVLSYATVGICLVQPYAVLDVSLWLSASATFGILLFTEQMHVLPGLNERERKEHLRFSRLPRFIRGIIMSLGVTLSATIITLPITASVFGTLPLLSPVANLLLSPFIQAEIYLAIAVLLFGSLPFVCTVADACSRTMMLLASKLSALPGAVLSTKEPFLLAVCLLLFLLTTLYFLHTPTKSFRLRVPVCILLSASLLLGGYSGFKLLMHKNSLTVTYLTYEQGQSDFFLLQDGRRSAVIDISGGTRSVLQRALSTLQDRGETEIDQYLLAAYHSNTENTICRLLSSEIVRSIYLPQPKTEEQVAVAATITQSAERNGTAVIYYEQNGLLALDTCSISFHPSYSMTDGTLAFSMYYGQEQLLYLSESALDYASESMLSRVAKLSHTVFLGTHGPSYTTSLPITAEDFTDATVVCGTAARVPFLDATGCLSSDRYQIKLRKA